MRLPCWAWKGLSWYGRSWLCNRKFRSALKINPKNKEAAALLAKYKQTDDAPQITSQGIKDFQKLSPADKKKANDVLKAQQELYNSEKKAR